MNLIEVEITLTFMVLDVAAMARLQKVESMTTTSANYQSKIGKFPMIACRDVSVTVARMNCRKYYKSLIRSTLEVCHSVLFRNVTVR